MATCEAMLARCQNAGGTEDAQLQFSDTTCPITRTMSDNTATQQPKLEARIRDACRVRHYSLATERAYVLWYKQFVR